MTAAQDGTFTSTDYPVIDALQLAGYKLTLNQWRVAGAWYAELRRPDGFWHEGGYGPTTEAALRHLDSRLARQEGQP